VIRLRPATAEDADLLLGWANDPVTRGAGFHTDAIDPATHARWLAGGLRSSSGRLFVGLGAQGRPIGLLRLDGGPDGRVEIGISVAPEVRSQGLGRELLHAGIDAARADPGLQVDVFVARIRPDNVASIRLFTGAGFIGVGSEPVHGQDALIYELPAG
jgi:RimJ/RimL family protein N-acetyltransferase